jgi:hypothetical protein
MREATDDYLKEMTKLMEVNSRLVSSPMRSAGQTGTRL